MADSTTACTFQVGDRVRVWDWEEEGYVGSPCWFFASRRGLTVVNITGPHHDRGEPPYFQLSCQVPPPHQDISYYNVCPIPARPWQMRKDGHALELIERAPLPAPPEQTPLFSPEFWTQQ